MFLASSKFIVEVKIANELRAPIITTNREADEENNKKKKKKGNEKFLVQTEFLYFFLG